MGIEKTFVMLKPDGMMIPGVREELTARYSASGLVLLSQKMVKPTRKLLRRHYAEFSGPVIQNHMDFIMRESKPFWDYVTQVLLPKYGILDSRADNLCMVWGGESAVAIARTLNGPTRPNEGKKTAPETLRAKYGCNYMTSPEQNPKLNCFNVVHASGNIKEAEREIKIWM